MDNHDKIINSKLDQILGMHGWTIQCESPFEVRHADGSFAIGQAASMVAFCVIDGWYDEDEEIAASEQTD